MGRPGWRTVVAATGTGATEVLVLTLVRTVLPAGFRSGTGPSTDRAVGTAAAGADADRAGALLAAVLVLAAAAAWTHWCLVVSLTAAGTAVGGAPARIAARIAPPTWRTAAATCLGLAVGLGPVSAAATAAADPPAGQLDGLPLPDRPEGSGSCAPAADRGGPALRTVQPGDTLWDLAAATVPPTAGDALIQRTWRAWYATNRRTIGPDPDLLMPGQQLSRPGPDEGAAR